MTKRQLIDEIVTINRTATPDFLAQFEDADLDAYLRHLQVLRTPRVPHHSNYERYFKDCPAIAVESAVVSADDAIEYLSETDADDQCEPAAVLDVNLSESAYFSASYEPGIAE
jgi:hypothetical protein